MSQLPISVELRSASMVPIYQLIAPEAALLRDRGMKWTPIARHFGVAARTVKNAVQWFDES